MEFLAIFQRTRKGQLEMNLFPTLVLGLVCGHKARKITSFCVLYTVILNRELTLYAEAQISFPIKTTGTKTTGCFDVFHIKQRLFKTTRLLKKSKGKKYQRLRVLSGSCSG